MRNTFKNYVVLDSNKEIYEIAERIAKGEIVGNGLVLIHGGHALGKSHLLDGIWHEYLNIEEKHAEWMSHQGFKASLDSAKYDIAIIASRFKDVSLLLIDDIDKVDDGRDGRFITELFAVLIKEGKQICITSNKRPSHIFGVGFEDLLSKGTCIELNSPNKIECINFCKDYAKKVGVDLYGDDAYDYLVEKSLNFRNIKGNIHKLKYYLIVNNIETIALSKGAIQKYLEA